MAPPLRLDLSTGHHLRPLREDLTELDYPGRDELARAPVGEVRRRVGLAQGHADARTGPRGPGAARSRVRCRRGVRLRGDGPAESEVLGCVYIDPRRGHPEQDAVASWWVVDGEAGGPLERALDEHIPRWLADAFGLEAVHVV